MPEQPNVAATALAEVTRAHERIDGHEALCTERWAQSRTVQDEIKTMIREMRVETRDQIDGIYSRLNRQTDAEVADARGTAAWWRGATFRWLGWGLAIVATLALASQHIK